MSMDEMIFYLKKLGFTEYEAKVYVSLLSQHPASAYTISKISGVPHSRVYDITRRLIKKGLALQAGKNPERFSPLAPEQLIIKLNKNHEHDISELEERLEQVHFRSDFDPVWNLHSREEALRIARDLIEEAQEHIYLGIWDEELEILLPALQKAHERGTRTTFLIYGRSEVGFGELFHHSTEGIAHVRELGRTIDGVVDSAGCISGSLGAAEPCQVVWTRNRGLVKSIEEYLIHDFYQAEITRLLGTRIEEAFGKNLARLRAKYGRLERPRD